MRHLFSRFVKAAASRSVDVSALEYGLISSLIAIGIILFVKVTGIDAS